MEGKENKDNKVMSIIKKLYNCRLKIDKKGKTILNWSSLFSLACLILAPHMSVAGIILSLILGYHISIETDQEDEELEQRFRQAADTVRKTATAAAKTIRDEVGKAKAGKEPERKNEPVQEAEPAKAAEPARTADPVKTAVPKQPAEPEMASENDRSSGLQLNEDVIGELEKKEKEFQANPAMYRSAYSAVAGSVPILEVHEEESPEAGRSSRQMEQ